MIKMNDVIKEGYYTVEYLQKMGMDSYGECPKCNETCHLMDWEMKKMCPECGYKPGIDKNPMKEQAFGEEEIDESEASDEAKRLNLVHIGFGNYSNTEGGPITYKTKDGVLTKVSGGQAVAEPKVIKKGAEEPPERTEPEEKEPIDKKKAKIKKIGVTDIKLVDEENQIYTFRYNDHPGRIKLSKRERIQLGKEDITKIILSRIQRKIARIKAIEKARAEKESEKQAEKSVEIPKLAKVK